MGCEAEGRITEVIGKAKIGLIGFTADLKQWGLTTDDFVICSELAFNLAGIPVVAAAIKQAQKGGGIDIAMAVDENRYKGPRVEDAFMPHKIILPTPVAGKIYVQHGLFVSDFLVEGFFPGCSTEWVDIGEEVSIQVLEPAANIRFLAENTVLRYSPERKDHGGSKIREWYEELEAIARASRRIGRDDLVAIAEEYIRQSKKRWGEMLREI